MGATLRFLGTGASGGTPGTGRSRRRESSLLVTDGEAVLIDVTRDFAAQARSLERIDALLVTHAHRDAVGGVAQLRRWLQERGGGPVPLYGSAGTLAAVRGRFARLDHLELIAVVAARPFTVGRWSVQGVDVPHARDCRTFAWRLAAPEATVVYASDVARPTRRLEAACSGADTLVVDGAMWGRSLFSHLRIDRDLPALCAWEPRRIVLTQIGRTAPPHARLARAVAAICPRALPAFDGMELRVGGGAR